MSERALHDVPLVDGTVNWSAVAETEIPCARCGYNLRGVELPRCPECGFAFEWADLFVPERRRHPFLYEHHTGTDRRRRFWRTYLANLRPRRFWRAMRVTHLHRTLPLAGYVVRSAVLFAVVVVLSSATASIQMPKATGRPVVTRSGQTIVPVMSASDRMMWAVELTLDAIISQVITLGRFDRASPLVRSVISAGLIVLVVPATYLGLWVFATSLRRHKVRLQHLLRLVIYPGSVWVVVAWLLLVVTRRIEELRPLASVLNPTAPMSLSGALLSLVQFGQAEALLNWIQCYPIMIAGMLLAWGFWWFSLVAAGTLYLGVPRWRGVVAISQAVALTAVVTAGVLLDLL